MSLLQPPQMVQYLLRIPDNIPGVGHGHIDGTYVSYFVTTTVGTLL